MDNNNEQIKKGINFATYELKANLVKYVQETKLPITNIKYVLLDIINEIVALEAQQIQKEQEEYDKSLEQEKINE